jgi:hypothetical protein
VIAGHFGAAAGFKQLEPSAPLWSLMLATMWLDVVFVPLLAAGVETIDTPAGGGYGSATIHADYTHSLVGALALSALMGGIAAWRWGRRVGGVLAAVAFSHWVLDLVVHRRDLPMLPGDAGGLPKLGFGLWRLPVASAVVEAALVVAGSFLYWRAAQRHAGRGAERGRVGPGAATGALLGCGAVVLLLDAVGL